MRIVLDTNVLVSGLLNPDGAPGRIVDLLLAGGLHLLYDDRILAKYLDVLERPYLGIQPAQSQAVIKYIRLSGERVAAGVLPENTLTDQDDLAFVEVAVTGAAEALVTGNLRHFERVKNMGLKVLSPAEFLKSTQE